MNIFFYMKPTLSALSAILCLASYCLHVLQCQFYHSFITVITIVTRLKSHYLLSFKQHYKLHA